MDGTAVTDFAAAMRALHYAPLPPAPLPANVQPMFSQCPANLQPMASQWSAAVVMLVVAAPVLGKSWAARPYRPAAAAGAGRGVERCGAWYNDRGEEISRSHKNHTQDEQGNS